MNRILMVLVGFLLLAATPQETFKKDFIDDVQSAYNEYIIVSDYTSETYSIQIVKGIVNDEATYGIAFFSTKANDYYLRFEVNNIEYKISPNSRGDLAVTGIKWRSYDSIKINIYNSEGTLQYPTHLTVLDKFDASSFEGTAGLNKGTSLTTLKSASDSFDVDTYIIVALIVIGFCSIIIMVIAKTKKGIFSTTKRKEGVFDFKAFINEEALKQDNDDWIEVKPEAKTKVAPGEHREVYKKDARYDDDEIESIDVSSYIRDAGFVTDYSLASDDEKNMIMLELMHLRDEKKISNDVYLEEIYKLWKK